MVTYSEIFIRFAVETGCLRFGEFRLKSGRIAPYFFNLGDVNSGRDLFRMGSYYARAILHEVGEDFDLIFGPAYKGIPLATSIAIALWSEYHLSKSASFDRKEMKEHGEGGIFLGRKPKAGDRVVMVDDVITTGGTKDEAVRKIRSRGDVEILALVVGLDRQEKTASGESALKAFGERHGIPVVALADTSHILSLLDKKPDMAENLDAMKRYLKEYGQTS